MTAFAIDFQRDRVTVAGDTLGYIPSRDDLRPLGFICKALPLPALKAVLFFRGQFEIAARAAMALTLSPHIISIEAAAAALPQCLTDISEIYADAHDLGDFTQIGLAEIVIAGWSEAEGRMRLWQFLSHEGYRGQDDGGAIYGVLAFPMLPQDYMPATQATGDARLVEIIQAQGRFFAENVAMVGPLRLGGEILSTEITPGGISTRTLYRFPDYEETRHAAAATVARLLRGELSARVADGLVPADEMVNTATGKPLKAAPANDLSPPERKLSPAERRRGEAAARRSGAAR
jgi:hypothetical protein